VKTDLEIFRSLLILSSDPSEMSSFRYAIVSDPVIGNAVHHETSATMRGIICFYKKKFFNFVKKYEKTLAFHG